MCYPVCGVVLAANKKEAHIVAAAGFLSRYLKVQWVGRLKATKPSNRVTTNY